MRSRGRQRLPHFGVDNVRVSVRSTAPTIDLVDRPEDIRLSTKTPPRPAPMVIRFEAAEASLSVSQARLRVVSLTLREAGR